MFTLSYRQGVRGQYLQSNGADGAIGPRRKEESRMQKKELNTSDTTDGHNRWSLWYCLVLGAGILGTGILLLWIGDGFPPLAWRQFAPLLNEHAPFRPQFALVLGQLAFLVAAWVLLFLLTIRSMVHVWHHGVAGRTTPRPGEQHLRGHAQQCSACFTRTSAPTGTTRYNA